MNGGSTQREYWERRRVADTRYMLTARLIFALTAGLTYTVHYTYTETDSESDRQTEIQPLQQISADRSIPPNIEGFVEQLRAFIHGIIDCHTSTM